MKTIEALQKRLQPLFSFELGLPERLYAGTWQRSAGAWSWRVCDTTGHEVAGSQVSMTKLLKMNHRDFVDWLDLD